MARRLRTTVPPELDGERLDRALARLAGGRSRARLREMVEDGRVRLDGRPVIRPAHPVRAGQALEAELVERDRSRPGGELALELPVLYEDADVAVVDKPPGMVCHPSSTVRGGTLSERLTERYGPLPSLQGDERGGIVHRLDADTSGVLVAARTEPAARALLDAFRERRVEKRYLALVHGDPRFESDWIEAPIGRSARHSQRMAVVPEGEGREAATFYEVVERFGDWALVSCRPVTGRTHQIRVHLSHVGMPLVGDRLYRGSSRRHFPPLPEGAPDLARHALHASSLAFPHPTTGERCAFEAELAHDVAALAAWLRARRG